MDGAAAPLVFIAAPNFAEDRTTRLDLVLRGMPLEIAILLNYIRGL